MKPIVRNIAAVGATDATVRLLGFLTTVYLSRTLGASGFGALSMGLAVVSYLYLLSSPGVHVSGMRDVAAARGPAPEEAGSIVSLRLTLALPLIIVAGIIAHFAVPDPDTFRVLVVTMLALLPMALSLEWYFQGREAFGMLAGYRILNAVAYLGLAAALVNGEGDAVWAGLAFALANLLATGFLLLSQLRRERPIRLSWTLLDWKKRVRESAPLGLSAFLAQSATSFPVILAGAMLSTTAAGELNAALKLVLLALMVDRVMYAVLFPALARHTSAGTGRHFLSVALKFTILLAIPLAVVGWFFAEDLVRLAYGAGFDRSAWILRLLLIYFAATLLNTLLGSSLVAARREKEFLSVMLTGTLVTVIACVALSLWFGPVGTAAGVALAEVVMTGLFLYRVRPAGNLLTAASILAGGAGMAAVMAYAQAAHPLIGLAGGIVAYLGLIALTGAVGRTDIAIVREKLL